MSYTYGVRGSPLKGGGLGGLPKGINLSEISIKTLQQGSVTVPASALSYTVTLDTQVAVENSVVTFSSPGPLDPVNSGANSYWLGFSTSSWDGRSFTLSSASTSGSSRFGTYQILEFGNVKRIQKVEITVLTGSTNGGVKLPIAVDPKKSAVFPVLTSTNIKGINAGAGTCIAWLEDSNTIRYLSGGSGSNNTISVSFLAQVVEFY